MFRWPVWHPSVAWSYLGQSDLWIYIFCISYAIKVIKPSVFCLFILRTDIPNMYVSVLVLGLCPVSGILPSVERSSELLKGMNLCIQLNQLWWKKNKYQDTYCHLVELITHNGCVENLCVCARLCIKGLEGHYAILMRVRVIATCFFLQQLSSFSLN